MKKKLIQQLKNYFCGLDGRDHFPDVEETPKFTIATLLDPRWKRTGFSSADSADRAVLELKHLVKEAQPTTTERPVLQDELNISDDWDRCFGRTLTPSTEQPGDEEVDKFLAEPEIDRQASPFKWWAAHHQNYLLLATLARRYLSCPLSSCASERTFKTASRIVDKRWLLKPESIEMLLFLSTISVT